MKEPNQATICNTALRVGMISALAMGIDEDACAVLIENRDGDFNYSEQVAAALEFRRRLFKKGGLSGLTTP